jgi:hypothetical protein
MRLLTVLLLALACQSAQSQPSPTPPKGGQVEQQKYPANQGQIQSDDGVSKRGSIIINNQVSATPSDRTEKGNSQKAQQESSLQGISDGLLALFTALLVVVAVLQWLTMRGHARELTAVAEHLRDGLQQTKKAAEAAIKTANLTEEALHLTQSADIHLELVAFNPPGRLTIDTVLVLCFRNLGKTRAKRLTHDLRIGIVGGNIISKPDDNIAIVVGPGQPMQIVFDSLRKGINDTLFGKVMKSELSLRIKGELRYLDIFDKPHRLSCEATYNPEGNNFITNRYEQEDDQDQPSD